MTEKCVWPKQIEYNFSAFVNNGKAYHDSISTKCSPGLCFILAKSMFKKGQNSPF